MKEMLINCEEGQSFYLQTFSTVMLIDEIEIQDMMGQIFLAITPNTKYLSSFKPSFVKLKKKKLIPLSYTYF